jgi:FPC/CPF motif-containing protein YcgG
MRIKTTEKRKLKGASKRSRFVPAEEPFPSEAQAAFQRLVTDFAFPCIGAKAALNSGAISFGFYERLATDASTKNLARDLESFTKRTRGRAASELATMIAVFRGPIDLDELEFEKLLWSQLQKLHDADAPRFAWDARVSSDPTTPEFSFSFAGQAYYVIGMHANSSRHARRFPWPTLVFNPHEQFEKLRGDGNWERMKRTIRARDYELQGSINPMLADFGERSEARQYSGRTVGKNWQAPFEAAKCPFEH